MENKDLIVIQSEQVSMSFTLRRTNLKKGQPTEGEYFEQVEKLCERTGSRLHDYVFEKEGGLHMHGILEVKRNINMLKFRTRGWKMYMEEIWNYLGWHNYMQKEQLLQYEDMDTDTSPLALKSSLFRNSHPPLLINEQ